MRDVRWSTFRSLNLTASALVLTLAGALTGIALAAPGSILISQKNRTFQPGEISLNRGDVVSFFNDDGDLLHNAYVDSETFRFDSGKQQPGSKTDVVFSVAGDFKILCGIHPKMKLLAHVK